jgi:triosephosphate isomerase
MNKNTPIIIANTKAYINNLKDFYKLQDIVWKKLDKESYRYNVAVPNSLINMVKGEKYKAFAVGSQNFGAVENGAYTGCDTAENVSDAGAEFVILGHSEVRGAGDTDENINDKIKKALYNNLDIVFCVGEKSRAEENKNINLENVSGEKRNSENKNTLDYVEEIRKQIKLGLKMVDKKYTDKITIAYEPVWAIGAARPATTDQVMEICIVIRRTLSEVFGLDFAKKIKIVYGGSVEESNAKAFLNESTCDGVLIGRACMDGEKFSNIVNSLYK